ncbi:hypothetical protein [Mesorhizobium sp.]|uniref:hypothetical protein n=1 Tax=Mesorhizobium sp. TaxID=1871066 RepID=UPI000FE88190|nr:hypothetical protein [Mesorhizobium sp.]RWB57129.1 MAG: hypothetical protein EOQ47_11115 [Mesorhizobium sp.]
MTGRRTHHLQMRIIEEPENTKNAPEDAEAELKRPPAEREARRKGSDRKTDAPDLIDPGDRNILRGKDQESEHNKNRGD